MSRLVAWTLGAALVGAACGAASALFLHGLEWVTATRLAHPWLPWLLPLAGLGLGLAAVRLGAGVKGGVGQVLAAAEGGPRVAPVLGPWALAGTWLTHLFGGSAGREGTAVQLGGTLADALAHRGFVAHRRALVLAGIAGGFGSVFGTPLAGALFAVEVVAPRRLAWRLAVPCLVAALVGDRVALLLRVEHTAYPHVPPLGWHWGWLVVPLAVALVGHAFLSSLQLVRFSVSKVPAWSRPVLGAIAVVLLWRLSGTDRYLGLGVEGIATALSVSGQGPWPVVDKLVFTALTVGSGFVGGEVTPVFFVGAHLGNVLSGWLGLPLAACGVVCLSSLFGAVSRAPLALAVMAAELSGLEVLPAAVLVGLAASFLSGGRSLYQAHP